MQDQHADRVRDLYAKLKAPSKNCRPSTFQVVRSQIMRLKR